MSEPQTLGEMVEHEFGFGYTTGVVHSALLKLGLWNAKVGFVNTVYDEAEVCVDGGIRVIVVGKEPDND